MIISERKSDRLRVSETQPSEYFMAQFITSLSAVVGGKKTKVALPISPNENPIGYTDNLPSYSIYIKKGTSPETVSFIKDTVSIFGKFFGV